MTTTPLQHGEYGAGHAAPSIEAGERQRLRREEAQADALLATVAHELAGAVDTVDALTRLCRLTVAALRCDYSCVLLWQPGAAAYVPAACHGVRADHWETLRTLRLSRAVMRDCIARLERDTLIQARTALVSATPGAPLTLKYGASASIQTVLRRGTATIGVLVAGYRQRPYGFTPQQEQIARGLGTLAALALEAAERMGALHHAGRRKSELLATVSHELRTPLNTILGYNDLLLDEAYGPLTPRQRATLNQVVVSAQELLDLVNAILDLSRVEQGQFAIEPRETHAHVGPVVHAIATETHPLRKSEDVALECHVPPTLPPLHADPTQLKVLLRNLIVNAIKFTERGMVTVAAVSRDGGIEITVSDTGIGMSAETLRRIFEPFHQADPSHPRRGGVGLGLFIVRRILEMLNGTIRVDSTPGRGSTFRVWLPHAAPSADGARTGTGATPLQAQPSAPVAFAAQRPIAEAAALD